MIHGISEILFWCYWVIASMVAILLLRELVRSKEWTFQISAALALLPFVLRILFIK